MKFKGSFPALVTPFVKNDIDFNGLSKLAKSIASKSTGLTLLGSTAESWLLTLEEKVKIVETCREATDKPLIIGISAWNIEDFNKQQKALSVFNPKAFLLAAPPYLNIDNYQAKSFFLGCSVKTKVNLILYHNPSRNGLIFDETIYNFAKLYPEIIGFKETSMDSYNKYAIEYPSLKWIIGDDSLIGKMDSDTSINIGGNMRPELFQDLTSGQKAIDITSWSEALSIAPNPMVIKQLLAIENKITSAACRSPLNHLRPQQKQLVNNLYENLKQSGILHKKHIMEEQLV